MEKGVTTRSRTTTNVMEDDPEVRQDSRSSSPGLSVRNEEGSEASLRGILNKVGRARRDNLRIYGIPEDREGTDMAGFLDNLLKDTLDMPRDRDLRIGTGSSSAGS